MDEDSEGNFRILTSTRQPQQATHLITLDKNLAQLGSLLNIEPGEQFKASRFMGDKLYLVTFEQMDPLFVIDLASLSTPKIIGELKIP
jgi:inhibitor of cysteine peptidase